MKNNFITKIIGATLAFAMMIGGAVGINANKQAKEAYADSGDVTVTWIAAAGDLGTAFTTFTANGTKTGTITTSSDSPSVSYNWSYTRTYKSGSKDTCSLVNATGFSSGKAMQLGQNGGVENLHLETSAISGVIKTVSVYCASYQAKHNISVKVGGTTYIASTATPAWGSGAVAEKKNSTLGNSEGKIEIDFTGGTRALYVSSISVTYGEAAPENSHTITFETNGGTSVDGQNVADAGTVNEPTDPTKRGFSFVDWYDNSEFNGQPYDFDTPVADDLTLYAKWEKVAETSSYSLALSNGDYRLKGEITAITGSSEFFIQSGNNVMHVGGGAFTSNVHAGNSVDLFGTYVANSTTISTLAYCDKDTEDTDIEQSYISDLANVTEANLCKYFRINNIQLNSGFDPNTKNAAIKNSGLIVYYNAVSCVNGGSFTPNNYSANDYVNVHGVIYKQNSTLGLFITQIEKPDQFVITFDYNDGRGIYTTQTVLSGATAQAPAAPTKPSDDNYNYSFAGWYTDEACNTAYNFSTAVASSFPLYAKWERSDRAAKEVIENTLETDAKLSYSSYNQTGFGAVDTLNNENTVDSSDATYTAWDNNASASGIDYSGFTAGQYTTVQLRSRDSNEGIITTANAYGYTATKITLTWNGQTQSGRVINVYGKNSAYSAPNDLYDDDAKGSSLGSLNYNDANANRQTTLQITGDYTYIGIRSNSGALYLDSIEIQWGDLPSYTYTDLKIRFAGKVSEALWTRLNSESTITGYGMLLSTTDAINNNDIANYYASAVDYRSSPNVKETVVKFPNTKATPNLSEGNYGWSLHKSIPVADYKTTFIAVAYIITENDGVIFLDEIRASAKNLAGSLIQDGTYEEDAFGGSLKYLADQ